MSVRQMSRWSATVGALSYWRIALSLHIFLVSVLNCDALIDPPTPLNCDNASITGAGAFVWNCTNGTHFNSSLRIVLPTLNFTMSANLTVAVEVWRPAFGEISIVLDPSNTLTGPASSWTVFIALCGGANNGSLSLSGSSVTVGGNRDGNATTALTHQGGVLNVVVELRSGVSVTVGNGSLVVVGARTWNDWATDVTFVQRNNSRVELDGSVLMSVIAGGAEAAQCGRCAVRLMCFDAVVVTSSNTRGLVAMLASDSSSNISGVISIALINTSLTLAQALLTWSEAVNATDGMLLSAASISLIIDRCTLGLVGVATAIWLRSGADVHIANVHVAATMSVLTFEGGFGGLVFLSAGGHANISNVTMTLLNSSSHMTGGPMGSLCYLVGDSISAVDLRVVIATISFVSFAQEGHIIRVKSTQHTAVALLNVTLAEGSTVVALGTYGSLISVVSAADSVVLSHCDVMVLGSSNISISGEGYIGVVTSPYHSETFAANCVVSASSVDVMGATGALFSCQALQGFASTTNASMIVSNRSVVSFLGEGYLLSVTANDSSAANDTVAIVTDSVVRVMGAIGALTSVYASGVLATTERHALQVLACNIRFAAPGFLHITQGNLTTIASNLSVALVASRLVTGDGPGSCGVCNLYSPIGDVVVSMVTIFVGGGSSVTFSTIGNILLAEAQNCRASMTTVDISGESVVTVDGARGSLCSIKGYNGTTIVAGAKVGLGDGSTASFRFFGTLLSIESTIACDTSGTVVSVHGGSAVEMRGEAYLLLTTSSLGPVVVTECAVGLEGGSSFTTASAVGYALRVFSPNATSVSGVRIVIDSSSINGTSGGVSLLDSTAGSVTLSRFNVTVINNSAVMSANDGWVLLVSSVGVAMSDVFLALNRSAITVHGRYGYVFAAFSAAAASLSRISILLTNAFFSNSQEGYLYFADVVTDVTMRNMFVAAHNSAVEVNGSYGAVGFVVSRAATVNGTDIEGRLAGTSIAFAAEGTFLGFEALRGNCIVNEVIAELSQSRLKGSRGGAIVLLRSGADLLPGEGRAVVSSSNIHVGVRRNSTVDIPVEGRLVLVDTTGDVQLDGLTVAVTDDSHCYLSAEAGGLLLYINVSRSSAVNNVVVTLTNSSVRLAQAGHACLTESVNATASNVSVVLSGAHLTTEALGSLWTMTSAGDVTVANLTLTMTDNSTADFGGDGYLVRIQGEGAPLRVSVDGVNVAVLSRSSVTIGGAFGALCLIFSFSWAAIVTSRISVSLFNHSTVHASGEGYLVRLSSPHITAERTLVHIASSGLSVVATGALLFANSDLNSGTNNWNDSNVALLSTRITIEAGGHVSFDDDGYLARADSQNTTEISMMSIGAFNSLFTFRGSIGAFGFFSAHSSVAATRANVTLDNVTAALGTGNGYLLVVDGTSSSSASSVEISVLGSTLSANNVALCTVTSSLGNVSLLEIKVVLSVGSKLAAVGDGYVLHSYGGESCTAKGIFAALANESSADLNGDLGVVCFLSSFGVTATTDVVAGLWDSSRLSAFGDGYALVVDGSHAVNAEKNTVIVAGLSHVDARTGAICSLSSSLGTVNASSANVTLHSQSIVDFAGEGYVLNMYGNVSCNVSVITATVTNECTVMFGGVNGGICFATSRGAVSSASVTVTITGRSVVTFQGGGYVLAMDGAVSCAATRFGVDIFRGRINGRTGALCAVTSRLGSVRLADAMITVRMTSNVSFAGEAYLLSATGMLSCVATNVGVLLSDSQFTLNESAGGGLVVLDTYTQPHREEQFHVSGLSVVSLGTTLLGNPNAPLVVLLSAPSRADNVSFELVAGTSVAHSLLSGDAVDNIDVTAHNATLTFASSVLVSASTLNVVNVTLSSVLMLIAAVFPLQFWSLAAAQSTLALNCVEAVNMTTTRRARLVHASEVVAANTTTVTSRQCQNWLYSESASLATISSLLSTEVSTTPSTSLVDGSHVSLTTSLTLSPTSHSVPSLSLSNDLRSISDSRSDHVSSSGTEPRLLSLTSRSRGFPVTVVTLAALSSIISPVSWTVVGIQAVGQRGAVRQLCALLSLSDESTYILADPSSNPLNIAIPSIGSALMYAAGSVLSSIVVAACFTAIDRGVDAARRCGTLKLHHVGSAAALCDELRFPGALYAPLLLVIQPLLAAAVVLTTSQSRTLDSVILGIAVAAVVVSSGAFLVWKVWTLGGSTNLVSCDVKSFRGPRRLLSLLFEDRYQWRPVPTSDKRPFARYGTVLASFRNERHRFIAAELGMSSLSGILSGAAMSMPLPAMCASAGAMDWSQAAIAVMFMLCVVLLRPYASLFSDLLGVVATAITVLCIALQNVGIDATVVNVLQLLQTVLGCAPLMLLLCGRQLHVAPPADNVASPASLRSIRSVGGNARPWAAALPLSPMQRRNALATLIKGICDSRVTCIDHASPKASISPDIIGI